MSKTDAKNFVVEPNGTIGVLGGGQLGRMLATAAAELGLKTIIYCPEDKAPAFDVASDHIVASYTDETALKKLAAAADAITYEFENVPVEAVNFLTANGAIVRPGAKALSMAQDRLFEKEFVNKIGAATAAFHPVDDLAALKTGLEKVGRPAILKTRRLGYDGKGQTRITADDADLSTAFEKAIEFAWAEVGAAPSILEGFVPFTCEISIIGARGADGDVKLYDPAENVHKSGILATSSVPAKVSDETADKARAVARKMLDELDYVGVIGVEFFVLESGDVIVNEYAPRVHNSGHWTQNACAVSQFEQHIRAVAGWPLGDPARHSNAVMENLIGDDVHQWRTLAAEPQTCVHLYGKRDARAGRKMGHVTRLKTR
ncbi:5-(carboxyamino)imidazole ribonucleotide synthase [Hyphococcus sp.]|uniref:5-(carboxyamino)imidazole ribonucleotide synthase n=1 Tax=Hyphococcus sp. TaxID=2038636 RepID=UPI0035C6B960